VTLGPGFEMIGGRPPRRSGPPGTSLGRVEAAADQFPGTSGQSMPMPRCGRCPSLRPRQDPTTTDADGNAMVAVPVRSSRRARGSCSANGSADHVGGGVGDAVERRLGPRGKFRGGRGRIGGEFAFSDGQVQASATSHLQGREIVYPTPLSSSSASPLRRVARPFAPFEQVPFEGRVPRTDGG